MSADAPQLPNVGVVLAAVLQRVPRAEQPLLIALAERLAAVRYRGWADEPAMTAHAAELRACAAREEDIAARIEGMHANAVAIQEQMRAQHPELVDINSSLFAGRPLHDQFTIQANGERLGAATWRSFARGETDAGRAKVLETCAQLEEASAAVLERITQST